MNMWQRPSEQIPAWIMVKSLYIYENTKIRYLMNSNVFVILQKSLMLASVNIYKMHGNWKMVSPEMKLDILLRKPSFYCPYG